MIYPAREREERIRKLLERLEWAGTGEEGESTCPSCGALAPNTYCSDGVTRGGEHRAGCELAAELGRDLSGPRCTAEHGGDRCWLPAGHDDEEHAHLDDVSGVVRWRDPPGAKR